MPSSRPNRRSFVKTAGSTAAAAGALAYFPWTEKSFANQSKNDRPQIGGIGLGGVGSGDCKGHANFGDIVAIADVDQKHAERAKADPRIGKGKADIYGDYRELLDRNDIDVVSIATPDHWHVKISVEALKY